MAQKRVDSHQHVNWHYRDMAGSIQDLDEQDIDYCWLLTWYTDPGDPVVEGKLLNPLNVRPDGSSEGITLREIPHPLRGPAALRSRLLRERP